MKSYHDDRTTSRCCEVCGTHLARTIPSWWTTCSACFTWLLAARHTRLARDLLRGLRK